MHPRETSKMPDSPFDELLEEYLESGFIRPIEYFDLKGISMDGANVKRPFSSTIDIKEARAILKGAVKG